MSEASPGSPYVGPRPFDEADEARFFGRERELEDLFDLLIAQRLVLLHSPSGAGKSSLIRARLLPRLETEGLVPNPVVRVATPEAAVAGRNRFVQATLLALGAVEPPPELTIAAFLDARATDEPEVFIFDQFEEVLTTTPHDVNAREVFFRQLGEALADERRWALFALREDYLGALRPLRRFLPTRLAATFRLDLLRADQARQALRGPAARVGVDFTVEAATRLVDDLRRTLIAPTNGDVEVAYDPTVEPVQLQVVALRLWEQRFAGSAPPAGSAITVADIEQMGDVNQALAAYYDARVFTIAAGTGVAERRVRLWFDTQLITPDQRRNQVIRQEPQSAGLDNTVIDRLVDVYLVRAEERRGAIWYELTHDRLVDPIRRSNHAWIEANLATLQKQATLWDASGRAEGLLLQGEALSEAEAWATTHDDELREVDSIFLDACVAVRTAEEQMRQEAREARERERARWSLWLRIAFGFAVALLVFSAFAWSQRNLARDAARNARVRQFAAQALADGELRPQFSLLTAAEAVAIPNVDAQSQQSSNRSLRATLELAGGWPLRGHQGPVQAVAYSPNGAWIATGGADTLVRLWPTETLTPTARLLAGHGRAVVALTFSPDSTRLISAGADGGIRIWSVTRPDEPPVQLEGHRDTIVALAISGDGARLLTASADQQVYLWDLGRPTDEPLALPGHLRDPVGVAFSPDGSWLASADSGGVVILRRVPTAGVAPDSVARLQLPGDGATATALAFSPDSQLLAVAGSGRGGAFGGAAWVWQIADLSTGQSMEPGVFDGHTQLVQALAFSFSADGFTRRLATFSLDGTARLWDLNAPERPDVLRGHTRAVLAGAFSPDGRWLATTSEDGTAQLWEADAPSGEPIVLRGHGDAIRALSFSPDGRWLVTASDDSTARIWRTGQASATPELRSGHTSEPARLALSPDRRWIASGDLGQLTFLWPLDDPVVPALPLDTQRRTSGLVFSPANGNLFASDFDGPVIRRWDVAGAAPVELASLMAGGPVSRLAFSATGRLLAAGGATGGLTIFRLAAPDAAPDVRAGGAGVLAIGFDRAERWLAAGDEAGEVLLADLAQPGSIPLRLGNQGKLPIRTLGFSPDGQILAVGGESGEVRLYDPVRGAVERSLLVGEGAPAHPGGVNVLAFEPVKGDLLATGGKDSTVRLWQLDAPTTQPLTYTLDAPAEDLAFNPEGTLLAVAVANQVQVFDLATPEAPPLILRGHSQKVNRVLFSGDGRLLTSSVDSTIRLWELRLERLRELACQIAGRNLTLAEWRELYQDEPYAKTCRLLGVNPTVIEALLKAGSLHEALARFEAERTLDAATEPPAAWLVRAASLLFAEGRTAEASEAYDRAVERDPNLITVNTEHLNQICVNAARQSLTYALKACDAAVARSPDYGTFRYNRANIRRALGERDNALEDYRFFVAWAESTSVIDSEGYVEQARRAIGELEQGSTP